MKQIIAFIIALAFTSATYAQPPVEYFTIGNPIDYCGTEYYLAWSSHPIESFYLQEYLPKGESFDHFNRMFSVRIIFDGKTAKQALAEKIAFLEQRKKTDMVCNYLTAEKDGSHMLEFIVSEGDEEGLDVVEFNLYYYRTMDVNGRPASVLTFYSERAYDDDILPFIKSIPEKRVGWWTAMESLNLPPTLLP